MDDLTLYLGDCLDFMARLPDRYFAATIGDPPYGIADVWTGGFSPKHGWARSAEQTELRNEWDSEPPSPEVIKEILRVSRNVCLWGGNHFALPPSRGWLIWLKPERGFSLSEAELAWTNVDMPMRVFEHPRSDPNRFHPTQKPLALMQWCVERLTKPGDLVFDPYMGSGTTGVACLRTGRRFAGCERDASYFAKASKRIHEAARQPLLFPAADLSSVTTPGLFDGEIS
jgi:site-specific DNA-methyltransferase (adenine-specific)